MKSMRCVVRSRTMVVECRDYFQLKKACSGLSKEFIA